MVMDDLSPSNYVTSRAPRAPASGSRVPCLDNQPKAEVEKAIVRRTCSLK